MMLRIFIALFLLAGLAVKSQNSTDKFYRTELDVNINGAFKNILPKSVYNSNKLTLTYKGIFNNRHVIYCSVSKYFDAPQHPGNSESNSLYHDSLTRQRNRTYRVNPGYAVNMGYQYLFKPKHHFQQGVGIYLHSTSYRMRRTTETTYTYLNTSSVYSESTHNVHYFYKGYGLTPNYTLHYFIYEGFGASAMLGYDLTRYTQHTFTDGTNLGNTFATERSFYRYGFHQLFLDLNVFIRF